MNNNIANSTQQKLAKQIIRRKNRRGTILVAAGAIMWATSGVCGKFLMGTKGFDPLWIASTRILISGILLALFGALQNKAAVKALFKNKKDLLILSIYGIFGMMLAQVSYLQAVNASNAAVATVLQYVAPVMIIFVDCIRKLQLPSPPEAISIFLAVTGVFLLATHGNLQQLSISPKALFWGFASATGFMIYSIFAEDIIPKYGSMLITGLGMTIGGVVLLFIARPWTVSVTFDIPSIIAYIGVAFTGTAVGYALYMQGVSDVGPVKSSMIASIEPVFSAIFSVIMGAAFVIQDYAGIACIVATIFMLSIPAKHVKVSFKPTHKKEIIKAAKEAKKRAKEAKRKAQKELSVK